MVSYLDRLILQSVLTPRASAARPSPFEPAPEPSGPSDIEIDETRVASPAAVPQPDPHPPGRGRDVGVAAGEPPARAPLRRSRPAPMPAEVPRPPVDGVSSREPTRRPLPPVEATTAEVPTPSHGPAPGRPHTSDGGDEPASVRPTPPRAVAPPPRRDMLVQRVIDWVAAAPPGQSPAPEPADSNPEPGRAEERSRRDDRARADAFGPMADDGPTGRRAPPPNRSRVTGVAVQRPAPDEPLPGRADPVQVRIDSIDLRIDPPRPSAPPPRPPVAAPMPRPRARGPDMSGSRLARRYIRP